MYHIPYTVYHKLPYSIHHIKIPVFLFGCLGPQKTFEAPIKSQAQWVAEIVAQALRRATAPLKGPGAASSTSTHLLGRRTNELRYYTILYCTVLYYTILYYTILYYTILYYTILFYSILYYRHGCYIRTWTWILYKDLNRAHNISSV